jgi:hypothetical protein
LPRYRQLIREKLTPGFWNETAGIEEVFFQFKLSSGELIELCYSPGTQEEIAQLCSRLNREPIDEIREIPSYLARNRFYRDLMVEHFGVSARPSSGLGPGSG